MRTSACASFSGSGELRRSNRRRCDSSAGGGHGAVALGGDGDGLQRERRRRPANDCRCAGGGVPHRAAAAGWKRLSKPAGCAAGAPGRGDGERTASGSLSMMRRCGDGGERARGLPIVRQPVVAVVVAVGGGSGGGKHRPVTSDSGTSSVCAGERAARPTALTPLPSRSPSAAVRSLLGSVLILVLRSAAPQLRSVGISW